MDDKLLKDLGVGGAGLLGGGAALAVAPAFAVPVERADLYHVTRIRDAEKIAREGLRPGMLPPSQKQADERVAEAGGTGMVEETNSTRAERKLQEIVQAAKRDVDSAEGLPDHDPAVFFWTAADRADTSSESLGFGTSIVGVDIEKVPPECDFAMGPAGWLDSIFEELWDGFRGQGTFDERELVLEAEDYWREVERLDMDDARSTYEVWTTCTIPPAAITHIEDSSTGRVLERPVEQDQRTLQEFM
jgi:hypothetical protein